VRSLYNPGKSYTWISDRAVKIGAALLFATGMFGALAALGDTLFPGTRGLVTDGHTYLKLRNIHPFLAVLTIGHILAVAVRKRDLFTAQVFSRYHICDAILFLTALQGFIGLVNILLSAPAYMQIIHLLGSDILWIFYGLWLFEEKNENTLR
jgi:cytochrome c oxidase assembly protein subunit 15